MIKHTAQKRRVPEAGDSAKTENISYRLVKKIESIFPGTEQVRRLGLENKLDKVIWDFAKKEQFTILTFDADFYDLSLLHGHPPKLIWVKSGNMTSKNLEKLLLEKANQIKIFNEDISLSCLEIVD